MAPHTDFVMRTLSEKYFPDAIFPHCQAFPADYVRACTLLLGSYPPERVPFKYSHFVQHA